MEDILLVDETLDVNLTLTYHMSMQLGNEGLTYCILDSVRNKFIALRHYHFPENSSELPIEIVDKIFHEDEFLAHQFKRVKFVLVSKKSTLIPAPLFDEDSMSFLYSFNHSLDCSDTFCYNHIKSADMYNVFAIPIDMQDMVLKKYPKAKFYHQGTPLIENILIENKNKTGKEKVFVNIHSDFFDIAVISSPALSLYNSFQYKDENDLIYFLMYVFEQLKLNPEKVEIILSGNIGRKSEFQEKISRYIRNIRFSKIHNSFTWSYTFNEIPSHQFVNLLNLSLCE